MKTEDYVQAINAICTKLHAIVQANDNLNDAAKEKIIHDLHQFHETAIDAGAINEPVPEPEPEPETDLGSKS